MRVDYSNGAEAVAIINIDNCEYFFDAQDEDRISDFLYERIGEREHELSGIPLFMEASSWCTLACVGETFEDKEFEICIVDWTEE